MNIRVEKMSDWKWAVEQILPLLEHKILLLKGNLGAGKTTFTQFLLKELGSNDEVTSPTYSIVNEYETPDGMIYHFDLYRMNDVHEVFDIGMEEYLDKGKLSIIEWPEIYEEELAGLKFHTLEIENKGQFRELLLQ